MVGLINLANGLSQMGQSVASSGLEAEKNALDVQKMTLADQLQGKREQANIAAEGANQIANTKLEGQNQLTGIAASGEQQRQTAGYTNTLPMTEAERAQHEVGMGQVQAAKTSAAASMMEAEKPISGGFTGAFLVRDPKSGKWNVQTAAGGGEDIKIDPNSNNLSAQTGLSEQAIRTATGQLNGRMTAPYLTELQKWGVKNGANVDTLLPQAKASFNVLQNNIQRNNQGSILEKEIQGSIDNSAKLADDIGQGRISMANILNVWAKKQVNDPDAVQAADQLGRLRNELAGYNAVAGGHLMKDGSPEPTPGDFREAEATISNGINSGGLKALSQSVAMSAAKNRNVLEGAIDKANSDYYSLFGAKYHAPNRAVTDAVASGGGGSGNGGTTPAGPQIPKGWTLHQDAKGNRAYVSPDGKNFVQVH